jgi:biopolymer transport protein TolQ
MFFSLLTSPVLGSLRATLDQPVFPGKVIVWLLFMLSIIGWVMILSKFVQLRKMKRIDSLFTERLRKSKTTLEVFEEGWEDELSLKYLIYHAGAREAAYQLLGSREPQESMQRRIKQAGKMQSRQLEFLKMAFQTGYRTAVGRLSSGIDSLRILAATALLIGSFGLVWTLMQGFDAAKEFSEVSPIIGGALGFLAIALLVAMPAILSRIAFQALVRMRKMELERFRDDINRLFERSFAGVEAVPARIPTESEAVHSQESAKKEPESAPANGTKRYHSIREKLLRMESEEEDRFEVNPIARQAASVRGF